MRVASNHSADMKQVISRIISENGRKHIGGYLFVIACLVITALSTAFIAWIMGAVVNEAFINRRGDLVAIICLSIFTVFVVRGIASYGQSVVLSKIGNAIVAGYQRRAYSHIMALSVGFFHQSRSAHIVSKFAQNLNGIRDVMSLLVTSTSRDILTLVALMGVMVYQDPILSMIVFLVGPLQFYILRYLSRRLRSATREAVLVNASVQSAIQETIQGISIVKAFTMEEGLGRKIGRLIDRAENRANGIARVSERASPITESLAGLAVAGVLAYAAYRSIYFNAMPGAFLSFVTALLMAYEPAKRLARLPIQLERAVVNAQMLYEFLDAEGYQARGSAEKELAVSQAQIEFRNVSFSYGTESIIRSVSFIAEGRKTTAIVGPSGAGKSTIISLIPRFFDPTEGQILIDGQDILGANITSLRQSMAYVSQQPYLFEGTISDNIRHGRWNATEDDVRIAAMLANAHDFIIAQPRGYDTLVGENGVSLSGGQRQRLSIARALVRNAPILLLDEATSALDTESEATVQNALDVAMAGRTVVVIAHRLSTIVNADKIVVIEDGRVVEEGSHRQLSDHPDGRYARLYNV